MRRLLRAVPQVALSMLGLGAVAAAVGAPSEAEAVVAGCFLCNEWYDDGVYYWKHLDSTLNFGPTHQGNAHYSVVNLRCNVHTPYVQGGSGGPPPKT